MVLPLVLAVKDSVTTSGELALADVLTGVPMAADYPLRSQSGSGGHGVLLSISRFNATDHRIR